jgi:hypothetical protein
VHSSCQRMRKHCEHVVICFRCRNLDLLGMFGFGNRERFGCTTSCVAFGLKGNKSCEDRCRSFVSTSSKIIPLSKRQATISDCSWICDKCRYPNHRQSYHTIQPGQLRPLFFHIVWQKLQCLPTVGHPGEISHAIDLVLQPSTWPLTLTGNHNFR